MTEIQNLIAGCHPPNFLLSYLPTFPTQQPPAHPLFSPSISNFPHQLPLVLYHLHSIALHLPFPCPSHTPLPCHPSNFLLLSFSPHSAPSNPSWDVHLISTFLHRQRLVPFNLHIVLHLPFTRTSQTHIPTIPSDLRFSYLTISFY